MILLVKTGGEEAVPEWRSLMATLVPGLDVRWWNDPSVDPADVAYVVVWEPDHGRLATYPNLKLIISSGAGVDHVLKDPHLPKHLPLVKMGAPEAQDRMNEFVRLGVLYFHRRFHDFRAAQATSTWKYRENTDAAQRTVGIMGLGNLGTAAAVALRDDGFKVKGWSRTPKTIEGVETLSGPDGLDPFLAGTEILVLLIAATPQTAGIVNARRLAVLPKGACIVNAARGSHVVIPDLIVALDSDHIGGAILDVFDTEPLPKDNPAWTHPKIIVTPHVASFPGRAARARFAASAIVAMESNQPLPNQYDPVRGY